MEWNAIYMDIFSVCVCVQTASIGNCKSNRISVEIEAIERALSVFQRFYAVYTALSTLCADAKWFAVSDSTLIQLLAIYFVPAKWIEVIVVLPLAISSGYL